MKRLSLQLMSRRNCPFSKFQMTIVKNLIMDFERSFGVLLRQKHFDIDILCHEMLTLFIFFEISTKMHFTSLLFLNQRKITTSLLMIDLKCTVVHYANLNLSFINKPFLNYGCWICYFVFFIFFIYYLCLFERAVFQKR